MVTDPKQHGQPAKPDSNEFDITGVVIDADGKERVIPAQEPDGDWFSKGDKSASTPANRQVAASAETKPLIKNDTQLVSAPAVVEADPATQEMPVAADRARISYTKDGSGISVVFQRHGLGGVDLENTEIEILQKIKTAVEKAGGKNFKIIENKEPDPRTEHHAGDWEGGFYFTTRVVHTDKNHPNQEAMSRLALQLEIAGIQKGPVSNLRETSDSTFAARSKILAEAKAKGLNTNGPGTRII